ncbi:MAG: glucose-1-phosphate adenylyltransferase subunit GlgD [Bacilli bacterium]|nr:glucose-1-phosphate adenylyltransferase subunit GlgD [Bacilli bacterium]
MKGIIGLLDCHNSGELGELTSSRPLASTSFLGRYAFADFALSNFTNSGINNVGILIKDHQRSMLKHMGNMMSFVSNTKIGRETIFYNEKGQLNPAYNTDINNIVENDWVLYDSDASLIVFQSPHIVTNIDLRPYIEEHIARKEEITIVYQKIRNADKDWRSAYLLDIDEEGYVQDIVKNSGKRKVGNVSLQIWIINRETLAQMIADRVTVDASFGLKNMIAHYVKTKKKKVHSAPYEGYARCFDSLETYVRHSFELLNRDVAETLFKPDWPIYTLTHDTPPAIYGEHASVTSSFISNGCQIDGEVTESIICRNVKIGKGARVNRCIILSNVSVGQEVTLRDLVIDKYVIVTARHTVAGDPKNIIYIKQGALL